jgi:hypothetical protein
LNSVVQMQDQLLAGSVEKRKEFQTQLEAITNLLGTPGSGFGQTDATNALASASPELFAGTQEAMDAQLAGFANMYSQIDQMRQADVISEQTAAQMRAKVAVQQDQLRLQNAHTFFGNLASLSRSENRELAAIGKAAAVTQATIDGVLAVQKALASAPPPANYALAAAVGVSAAANVAQILGAGFMTGGEFTVGGSGGADSQMVAFRASPGEKVAVSTPTQIRKGDPGAGDKGGSQPAQISQRIINVMDPAILGDFLAAPEGEQVLINFMQRNSDTVRQIVGDR